MKSGPNWAHLVFIIVHPDGERILCFPRLGGVFSSRCISQPSLSCRRCPGCRCRRGQRCQPSSRRGVPSKHRRNRRVQLPDAWCFGLQLRWWRWYAECVSSFTSFCWNGDNSPVSNLPNIFLDRWSVGPKSLCGNGYIPCRTLLLHSLFRLSVHTNLRKQKDLSKLFNILLMYWQYEFNTQVA